MNPVYIVTAAGQGWRAQFDHAVTLCAAAGVSVRFVAVNDVGVVHPDPLHEWVSLHSDQFRTSTHRWLEKREREGLKRPRTWGPSRSHHSDDVYRERPWRDMSSGGYAVGVSLSLGASAVICCGVPIDSRPNELNPRSLKGWDAFQRFRLGWEEAHRIGGLRNVRSLAGWTSELCGAPTVDWLRGLIAEASG